MIGIIGAMEEEVAILKDQLTQLDEIHIAHVKFYRGQLLKCQHNTQLMQNY